MTEEIQQAIDDAPEQDLAADNDGEQTQEIVEPEAPHQGDVEQTDEGESQEFPKKAVNALNRKNKQINKLRAQMRELEAKLEKLNEVKERPEVDIDKYENYDDYFDAKVQSLVEHKTSTAQTEAQKQQLEMQKQQIQAQRNQYIFEQAQEASKALPDLPQVWQQNEQVLNALPPEISDVFYSIENAPAAIYTLAKEGKLESLIYANPLVAANEILNAQSKGLEMLSKQQKQSSQAPQPISRAKGTGSLKKQLSPDDNVLKSLGFKK